MRKYDFLLFSKQFAATMQYFWQHPKWLFLSEDACNPLSQSGFPGRFWPL